MMPICPDKMKLYPGRSIRSKEWLEFRASILARSENRCEGTDQHPDCRAENGKAHPETGSRVVLTIAHMDWDESHADPERCRALCQRCHLTWDAKQHAQNAARTRKEKISSARSHRLAGGMMSIVLRKSGPAFERNGETIGPRALIAFCEVCGAECSFIVIDQHGKRAYCGWRDGDPVCVGKGNR